MRVVRVVKGIKSDEKSGARSKRGGPGGTTRDSGESLVWPGTLRNVMFGRGRPPLSCVRFLVIASPGTARDVQTMGRVAPPPFFSSLRSRPDCARRLHTPLRPRHA